MNLKEKIADWGRFPNALGSEAQAAVIVGEVAEALGKPIPDNVRRALKSLSLRGTMRDIASAIEHHEGRLSAPGVPSFHDLVDVGAGSCGISWGDGLAEISQHLAASVKQMGGRKKRAA